MAEVCEVLGEGVVILDEVRYWQVQPRAAFPFRPRIVNGPAAGGRSTRKGLPKRSSWRNDTMTRLPSASSSATKRLGPERVDSESSYGVARRTTSCRWIP